MTFHPSSAPASPGPCRQEKQRNFAAVIRQGFVPVFVNDDLDSRRLVEAAVGAGCRVLEYSCRRADAREMIPWIKRTYPGVVVLAATLLDGPKVSAYLQRTLPGFLAIDEAVDLGADGLVSYLRFQADTYARYGASHVMVAGVGSPNEALDQLELGADLIKVTVNSFAGRDLVIKSRVPTHGCIPYFISGGLTRDSIEPYIEAGVVATAAGFDVLLGDTALAEGDVKERAREAIAGMIATVQSAREKHQPRLLETLGQAGLDPFAAGPWFRQ